MAKDYTDDGPSRSMRTKPVAGFVCTNCGSSSLGSDQECSTCKTKTCDHARRTINRAINRLRHLWSRPAFKIGAALFVLIAIVVGVWEHYYRLWCREQSALAIVQRLRGSFTTRNIGPAWANSLPGGWVFTVVDTVDFSNTPAIVTNEDAKVLGAFLRVRQINLSSTQVGDDGLSELVNLNDLTTLHLESTLVGDRGVSFVCRNINIQSLWLTDTRITDAGVSHLQSLPRLRELGLSGTDITDKCALILQNMVNLEVLGLAFTEISDVGLVGIGRIASLKDLDLWATRITDNGLQRLGAVASLTRLNISCDGVSGKNPHAFDSLLNLRLLIVNGNYSYEGIQALRGRNQLVVMTMGGQILFNGSVPPVRDNGDSSPKEFDSPG